MDYLLDLLQGLGIAAAIGIRPFLPTLLAGALAAGDVGLDFGGTDFSFLEKPPFLIAMFVLLVASAVLERRPSLARQLATAMLALSLVLGALLASASIADGSDTWWPGVPIGVAAASLGYLAVTPLFTRVRSRLDAAAAAALPLYAEGAALIAAGASILFPPLAVLVVIGLAVLLLRGRRREGEKYAGLRILALKKLVLAVIDAMKPAMLERAVASGRAPTLQLLMERGHFVDECVAAFPSRDARVRRLDRHRHRAGRARDPGDELVAPRRGSLRRVRHELRRVARVRHPPVAHGHDLQHEPRAPLTRRARRCSRRSTTRRSAPRGRRT